MRLRRSACCIERRRARHPPSRLQLRPRPAERLHGALPPQRGADRPQDRRRKLPSLCHVLDQLARRPPPPAPRAADVHDQRTRVALAPHPRQLRLRQVEEINENVKVRVHHPRLSVVRNLERPQPTRTSALHRTRRPPHATAQLSKRRHETHHRRLDVVGRHVRNRQRHERGRALGRPQRRHQRPVLPQQPPTSALATHNTRPQLAADRILEPRAEIRTARAVALPEIERRPASREPSNNLHRRWTRRRRRRPPRPRRRERRRRLAQRRVRVRLAHDRIAWRGPAPAPPDKTLDLPGPPPPERPGIPTAARVEVAPFGSGPGRSP